MSHYSYIYCFITMPIKLLKWELLVASNGPDLFFHIIFLHYIHHFICYTTNNHAFNSWLWNFSWDFLSLIFRLNASLSSCYHTLSSSLLRNLFFPFFFSPISLLFYRVIFLPQLIKMCQNGGNRKNRRKVV